MAEEVLFCPRCGAVTSRRYRFCPQCGEALAGREGEDRASWEKVLDESVEKAAAAVRVNTVRRLEEMEDSLCHLEEEIESFLGTGGKKE